MEVFQLENEQGLCLDRAAPAPPSPAPISPPISTWWPLFVPAAVAAGFRSVVALPLRLRDQTIAG